MNREYWVYLSIVSAVIAIITILLSQSDEKEYYVFGIVGVLLVFNLIFVGKKLCLYRETSPRWLKLSISIFSTIGAITLIYLILSIFIPTLPLVDTIEIVCEISIGAGIILIFVERKIFNVIDNSHDLMNNN